jgi:hypothetical protein
LFVALAGVFDLANLVGVADRVGAVRRQLHEFNGRADLEHGADAAAAALDAHLHVIAVAVLPDESRGDHRLVHRVVVVVVARRIERPLQRDARQEGGAFPVMHQASGHVGDAVASRRGTGDLTVRRQAAHIAVAAANLGGAGNERASRFGEILLVGPARGFGQLGGANGTRRQHERQRHGDPGAPRSGPASSPAHVWILTVRAGA